VSRAVRSAAWIFARWILLVLVVVRRWRKESAAVGDTGVGPPLYERKSLAMPWAALDSVEMPAG